MRKQVALIGLSLVLSVMIGMAFVTANMGDVVDVDVWIWPPVLTIEDDYHDRGFDESVVAFIKFPKDYSTEDVDLSSITLQTSVGSVPVSKCYTVWERIIFAIFDRADVIDLLLRSMGHMTPRPVQRVTLVVMGNLLDGNVFKGEDTITVFFAD